MYIRLKNSLQYLLCEGKGTDLYIIPPLQKQGEYRVALPDGRTQIVTYRADHVHGFIADVKYEGHATYHPAPPKIHYRPKPYHQPHH